MSSDWFTQVLDSWIPRHVAELQFNAAAGGSAAGYKRIYLVAERLATGTQPANTVGTVPLASADDAIRIFGAGSFGAWMGIQLFRGGKLKCRVYPCPVTEPAGVAASRTYVFASNAGTNGTYTVNVAGTVFSFTVTSGDTPTLAGDKMVAKFNELPVNLKPPCTLVNAAGTVTATMNNKGAVGNTAPSYQVITGAEPTTQTLTIATPTFASGTLYPTLTTILAALNTVVTPCICHAQDETPDGSTKNLDLIRDHLNTKCAAEVGHRGVSISCITKALATCLTDIPALNTGDDAERMRVGVIPVNTATDSPGSWHVSASAWLANLWGQQLDTAYPYNNVYMPYMVKPPDDGDVLVASEIDSLIEIGASPLNYHTTRGRYELVKGIGARLFGGNPQPWSKVDVADELRFSYMANLALAFPAGTKLAQDGEENLDSNTTTPSGVLDILHSTIFSDRFRGKLRNRETLWQNAEAEINTGFEGRVDAIGEFAVMSGLDITATLLRERSGFIAGAEE